MPRSNGDVEFGMAYFRVLAQTLNPRPDEGSWRHTLKENRDYSRT
jgi:hypothetical protein